jgi:hypothetical protein
MILTLLLLAQLHISANCVLTEGSGADFARLGVTTRGTTGSPPDGVTLEYDDNFLVRIYVHTDHCRTSKGIKVGDSQSKVQMLYGKGKRTTAELKKGASDSLGKFGDFILEYPGVAFVMSKSQVAGIFITATESKNRKSGP